MGKPKTRSIGQAAHFAVQAPVRHGPRVAGAPAAFADKDEHDRKGERNPLSGLLDIDNVYLAHRYPVQFDSGPTLIDRVSVRRKNDKCANFGFAGRIARSWSCTE